MPEESITIHANCLKLGEKGVLIAGETGSGKSLITLALLERAKIFGNKAVLICDDYTILTAKNKKLYANCPPTLQGGIEIRGAGLFKIESINKNLVDFVVQLGDKSERLPSGQKVTFCGIERPLYSLPSIKNADSLAICHAIEAFCFGTIWKKTV